MYNRVVTLVHHAFKSADYFSRGGFLDCEFYRQVKVHLILNPFAIDMLLKGRYATLQDQGTLPMFLVKVPRSKVLIGDRISRLQSQAGRVRKKLALTMPQAIHKIPAVDVSVGFSISSVLYLTLHD
jgi:hypothetical protein